MVRQRDNVRTVVWNDRVYDALVIEDGDPVQFAIEWLPVHDNTGVFYAVKCQLFYRKQPGVLGKERVIFIQLLPPEKSVD